MTFLAPLNKRKCEYQFFDMNFIRPEWKYKQEYGCNKLTHKISILRQKESFPSFPECPGQGNGLPSWFQSKRFFEKNKKLKYCYIGEITELTPSYWVRPGCYCKDICGNEILIGCYLKNSKPKSYFNGLFKPGTVLLNLQGFGHMFNDGNAGFRIEDDKLKNLVNIDISLKELIGYSDTGCFLDYYFEKILNEKLKYSYNNKCWYKNCNDNKKNNGLFRCTKCCLAKYCCKEHQRKDWNIRHKRHCKHVFPKIIRVLRKVDIYRNQDKYCNVCGKTQLLKYCSKCKNVMYCGRKCQKWDWNRKNHKIYCI